MDKRIFTLRLDDILFDKLKVIAGKNKHSLNKQIEFLVDECIDDYERENGPIKIEIKKDLTISHNRIYLNFFLIHTGFRLQSLLRIINKRISGENREINFGFENCFQRGALLKRTHFSFFLLVIISIASNAGCNQTEPFFGKWVVSKVAGTSKIYVMSEAEMKSFIGKKAKYSKGLATFAGESLENPIYKKETLSKTDFFSSFRTYFENLDLKGESVTIINVYENKENLWINPGSCLIVKENSTMITIWDGVFFELKRL